MTARPVVSSRARGWAAVIGAGLLAAGPALAQPVFKCVKNGQVSFQGTPCEGAAASSLPVRTAAAPLPWEGLRRGMAPEEVKRIASAEQPSRDEARALHKPGVTIAGIAFSANYHFDGARRLVSVIAERQGDSQFGLLQLVRNDTNQASFEQLVAFFRAKHGTEASRSLRNKDNGFPGLAASAEWATRDGRLFVSVSPVTADTSTLSVGLQLAGPTP